MSVHLPSLPLEELCTRLSPAAMGTTTCFVKWDPQQGWESIGINYSLLAPAVWKPGGWWNEKVAREVALLQGEEQRYFFFLSIFCICLLHSGTAFWSVERRGIGREISIGLGAQRTEYSSLLCSVTLGNPSTFSVFLFTPFGKMKHLGNRDHPLLNSGVVTYISRT